MIQVPMPDAADIEKRAAIIYEQDRDVYDFGPPPFSHVIEVRDSAGRVRKLRLGSWLPYEPSMQALEAVFKTAAENPDRSAEIMRASFSFMQAATEMTRAQFDAATKGES